MIGGAILVALIALFVKVNAMSASSDALLAKVTALETDVNALTLAINSHAGTPDSVIDGATARLTAVDDAVNAAIKALTGG